MARYKLGLGLEGDSPEEDTSLSSIVGNAIMPSLDTSSSVVPAEDYNPSMPNIDFNSLNPAEPEVSVANPNVDYLSSILDEAKQIKDLREQASVAAKQELDPEQSIATVLMSAIPAILGLAVSGKRGLASAGLVSGPAAMKYAEERRNDRKNEAAALNQQASALQQALNLKLTEEGREQRSQRAIQSMEQRAAIQRQNEIADATKKEQATITKADQKREEARATLSVQGVKPIIDAEGRLLANDNNKKIFTKDLQDALKLRDAVVKVPKSEMEWNKLTSAQKESILSPVFAAANQALSQGGKAITGTEVTRLFGFTPPNMKIQDILDPKEFLGTINKYVGGFTAQQARDAIENMAKELVYRSASVNNYPLDVDYFNAGKQPVQTKVQQAGMFSNNFRSMLQDIAEGK